MRVTFGGYSLDLATRQLLRGGVEVRLSPKAFALLQVLVESRTRAVSKAELHDRLWPGTYVTDANLSVLVAELRTALRDASAAPKIVRTVRGFGYAFCARVDDEGAAAAPSSPSNCWIVRNGREVALSSGENLLGRDPAAAVRLDVPSVSRRHARILVSPTGFVVEDLGSKNGTFVGNRQITGATPLADLDELQIGSVRLVVRILSGDSATHTLAGT